MDWRGEHLIRSSQPVEMPPQRVAGPQGKRVGDQPYLDAHAAGMTALEAAKHIGVSRPIINAAEARLGIRFGRDKPGRKT